MAAVMWNGKSTGCDIRSWPEFARTVRPSGCPLLRELPRFPRSVLVAGCQRSGTTIVTRILNGSADFVDYRFGRDDELDAALVLSGYVDYRGPGRHCFQTTYLNECYTDYFDYLGDSTLVWVLRNPHSVVYSLLYNWSRWALNELFDGCGARLLAPQKKGYYRWFGKLAVPPLERACLSYNAKLRQLHALRTGLPSESLVVVEYDELVAHKERLLPMLFERVGAAYDAGAPGRVRRSSLRKKNRLSQRQWRTVERLCAAGYEQARTLVSLQ